MEKEKPDPASEKRSTSNVQTLRRSLSYLRPYKWQAIGAYALLLVNNGITLAMPLIIRSVVDQGIRGGETHVILWGAGGLMVLTIVRGVFTFLSGRWTEVASRNVAFDLRNALHRKLQFLSFSYHDRAETGQLLARAIGDVDRVRFLTGRAFIRLAEMGTLVAGVAVGMMLMHARLALVTLSVTPFLALGAWDFGRRYRPMWREIRKRMEELTTRLEQNLRGARIVKGFAQEDAECERFDQRIDRLFDQHMEAAKMRAVYLPLLRLFGSAATIAILLYGGRLVIRNELTLGELVAFTTYVGQLLVPIRRFGWIIAAIAQAISSGDRVFEILDTESDVKDRPGARPLHDVMGRVRFDHVSFSYFGRHEVLHDINFEAKAGQIVALLGATGSGKSSIINLIPRFYDPTEGAICIDGYDIRDVTVESLRSQIGIVLQDTTLFAATVRENVAFGRPDASDEEVRAAARAASAHEFIQALPEGYDAPVGEQGSNLSGGQKQRLALARAILKNPRILILDDATSSVDTETEAEIQEALARLMEGRTSFVIAQRLSTIRRADQVLVLDDGRIVARGVRTSEHTAHEHLLDTSGLYAEIYYRQLRPAEMEADASRSNAHRAQEVSL
jgi:ATP-binding cassette subfamily B protein